MPYGIVRGLTGVLAIAASVGTFFEIKMNESRTPNEIADRNISPNKRQEYHDMEQAIRKGTGPIVAKAKEKCKQHELESAASNFNNHLTVSLLKSLGAKTDFDMGLCVKHRVSELTMFHISNEIPDSGSADERYKQSRQEGLRNTSLLLLAFGTALSLSSYRAMRQAKKEDDASLKTVPSPS